MMEVGVILQSACFLLESRDKIMKYSHFSYLMNERRREIIKRSRIPMAAMVMIVAMERE